MTNQLYIVADVLAGYAREDAGSARVIGAYTQPDVAALVAKGTGPGAKVETIQIDKIPLGIAQYLKELGFKHPALGNDPESMGL